MADRDLTLRVRTQAESLEKLRAQMQRVQRQFKSMANDDAVMELKVVTDDLNDASREVQRIQQLLQDKDQNALTLKVHGDALDLIQRRIEELQNRHDELVIRANARQAEEEVAKVERRLAVLRRMHSEALRLDVEVDDADLKTTINDLKSFERTQFRALAHVDVDSDSYNRIRDQISQARDLRIEVEAELND